ncbi:MAG: hypothetical protein AAFQ80_25300 [Cyanobacteria bacterium J06621_8]
MQIKFVQAYNSIEQFDPVDLADFTVLTGVNGSGKSHLLEAIKNKKVVIAGMEQANIIHFNYESFRLDNEAAFNAQQITEEKSEAWNIFQQKIQPIAVSLRQRNQNNDFENLKIECDTYKKSFLKTAKELLPNYWLQVKKSFKNNNSLKNNIIAKSIFYSVINRTHLPIDEIEEIEFKKTINPTFLKMTFYLLNSEK